MIVWIFRIIAVLGAPLLAYHSISPDSKGVLIGLACGVVIVAAEYLLESINLMTMIVALVGAIFGIIAYKAFYFAVLQVGNQSIAMVWERYSFISQFALILLGAILAVRKIPELDGLDKDITTLSKARGAGLKVVDTSAIIDGRIVDICETHFISGTLVVPRFVLNELHALADSPDQMKRARGRRGLDILARLQELKCMPLRIMDKDLPELKEVDAKLIRLSRDMGSQVITTDFNMHKLAVLEGVTVLNVNDLSTALKPVVLPGESMSIFVMKDGKEKEQGVGYLDDGTMVVVEEGRRWIGKRVEVAVYSILQTSAGRMIFAKAKPDAKPQQVMQQPEHH